MPEIPIIHNLPQYQNFSQPKKHRLLAKLVTTLVKYRYTTKNSYYYTWGQEIEVLDEKINEEFKRVSEQWLGGHRDGSGPWEFTLYPTKYNDPLPAFIIAEMQRQEFFDIIPAEQMGNHLHYRPSPLSKNTALLWWRTYINIYVLSVLSLRMLSSHGDRLRESWSDWARLSYQFNYLLGKLPTEKELEEFYYDLKYWSGREYSHVTFNKHRKETLTIEIRLCEAHPLKAWAFTYLVTKILKTYNKPLFLVEDFDLFGYFYIDFANGDVDEDEAIIWKDIGLKPIVKITSKPVTLREFILKLTNLLDTKNIRDRLAMMIFQYVYSEKKDIIDKSSINEFYKWLREKMKKKTIIDYLI